MKELSDCTVLVVDDTEANVDILVDALGEDYGVSVAMDGRAALEAVEEEPPDLILLDIMMPEMDGYEVCRRLKSDKKTENIPIIFVTIKGEVEDEQKGLELGAVDYISKPFSPPIVKARVKNHLLIKIQHDQLTNSISNLQHEAEILGQKAELGIQAGGLAHDINNVLAGIMIAEIIPASLPVNFPGRENILKNISNILKSAHLGRDICLGYTNYLRNVEEKAKVQPVFPLLQPIDIFARRYMGKLERDIATDIPPIECKSSQLKRIFVNLFVNASQAIENKSEQIITIRLWSEADRVLFSIQDNGTGIPEDILPLIFEERFTTKPDGTGLGLFLVKQIMNDHGGEIDVTSKQEKGTTITISFPAIVKGAATGHTG